MIHALLNARLEEIFPHHRPLVVEVISALLGAVFVASGLAKLLGPAMVDQMWAAWGYPLWFQYVVGVFEVVAGGLLFVEGFALLGAVIAAVIMGGAVATHVQADETMMIALPVILMVGLGFVALQGVRLRELPEPADDADEGEETPRTAAATA